MKNTIRTAAFVAVAALSGCVTAGGGLPRTTVTFDEQTAATVADAFAARGIDRKDGERFAYAVVPGAKPGGYRLPGGVGGQIEKAAVVLDPIDADGCREIQMQAYAKGKDNVWNATFCRPPLTSVLQGELDWFMSGPITDISPAPPTPPKVAAPKPTKPTPTKKAAAPSKPPSTTLVQEPKPEPVAVKAAPPKVEEPAATMTQDTPEETPVPRPPEPVKVEPKAEEAPAAVPAATVKEEAPPIVAEPKEEAAPAVQEPPKKPKMKIDL